MSDEEDPQSGDVVPFRPKKPRKESGDGGSGRRRRRSPSGGTPGSSGYGNSSYSYRPGQNVICKIIKAEPGGYSVIIPRDNLPGYLPTQKQHLIGEELLVTYICIDKNRMLLAERYGKADPTSAKSLTQIRWQGEPDELNDQLSELDDQCEDGNVAADADPYELYMPTAAHVVERKRSQRRADHVATKRIRLQRAVDLIMPPIDADMPCAFGIGNYDAHRLITDLEGGLRTGCVKTSCRSRLSRGAMLLYRGRSVGCIYSSQEDPVTKPTEESLDMMLCDLESPDTMVTLYDLPDNVTLAMSSLFLGYPVERSDDYTAREYLDYICDWLETRSGTGTLALSLGQNRGICLAYIYQGEYIGAFYVEEQIFRKDREYVDELLCNDPHAGLEVSILPPSMFDDLSRFGFNLSVAWARLHRGH